MLLYFHKVRGQTTTHPEASPTPEHVSELLANHYGSSYAVTKDKACTASSGYTGTPLALALTFCDLGDYPCAGIFDQNCDGTSVVVCAEITHLEPNATTAGCTYVKEGNPFLS